MKVVIDIDPGDMARICHTMLTGFPRPINTREVLTELAWDSFVEGMLAAKELFDRDGKL